MNAALWDHFLPSSNPAWSRLGQDDIGDRAAINPANRPTGNRTLAQTALLVPLSLWITQSVRNRGSTVGRSAVVGATAYSRVLVRCIDFGEV